jgi:hypothetical protein
VFLFPNTIEILSYSIFIRLLLLYSVREYTGTSPITSTSIFVTTRMFTLADLVSGTVWNGSTAPAGTVFFLFFVETNCLFFRSQNCWNYLTRFSAGANSTQKSPSNPPPPALSCLIYMGVENRFLSSQNRCFCFQTRSRSYPIQYSSACCCCTLCGNIPAHRQ